jgi:hypothetical protein
VNTGQAETTTFIFGANKVAPRRIGHDVWLRHHCWCLPRQQSLFFLAPSFLSPLSRKKKSTNHLINHRDVSISNSLVSFFNSPLKKGEKRQTILHAYNDLGIGLNEAARNVSN